MKDFEPQQPQDNKVITAEQRQVTPREPIISTTLHPGHIMWEFDLSTGTVEPAKIDNVTVTVAAVQRGEMAAPTTIHKKIVKRPNCLYAGALNRQNAIKHFAKMYERLVTSGQINRGEVTNEN